MERKKETYFERLDRIQRSLCEQKEYSTREYCQQIKKTVKKQTDS